MINLLKRALSWLQRLLSPGKAQVRPRQVVYVESDELPVDLPPHNLVVAREADTLWVAGFVCPCGCGRRLELMLLEGVRPRWDLTVDADQRPTLHPSVWVADGCRSHFWLRRGIVHWCK